MKRVLTLLGVAALVVSCDSKKEEAPPIRVSVTPAKSEDVTVYQTWVGLLNGYQNADVRAQVTGYLLSQEYKEGSFVAKDTILFQIDPRPFEASLAQAQADYAQKVAQAQLAQITLERETELFEKQVISQQEYDTSAQNAQAAIALAAAAQASVQSAQVNLAYCTISAPFDGIVGKAQAQIGDLVGPGGSETVLTQISQVDPIKAIFSITEREYLYAAEHLLKLEKSGGTKNVISLTLANGQEYGKKGKFYFINRQVDVATGTITIETLFDNPDSILRPGLFARVTAPVKQLPEAVVVPQKALVEMQGNHLISVVASDGTVSTYPVMVGPPAPDSGVVVKGNIKPGDQVVVEGVEKVRPGMKVQTAPYTPPQPRSTPGSSPSASPTPGSSPAASPKPGPAPDKKSDAEPESSPSASVEPAQDSTKV